MKRIIAGIIVCVLVFAWGSAYAQGGSESQTYYLDANGQWILNGPDGNARLLRTGEPVFGACNKLKWEIPVLIHASVAQWIDFRLSWNQWDWFIRKPGCYAGNSIEMFLKSNGDVYVDYSEFDHLQPVDGNPDKNPVEISYSFEYGDLGGGVEEAEARGWVPAPALNDDDDLIIDVPVGPNGSRWPLHFGVGWKLWNKICVINCNTACEYIDKALITLVLRNQKPWIEEDGGWGEIGRWTFPNLPTTP